MNKWRCRSCGWVGVDLLLGTSPFDPKDIIRGCPKCKVTEFFDYLCDTEGCEQLVSAGTPSKEGYRFTCHRHLPKKESVAAS